jgi:hypothetical protein
MKRMEEEENGPGSYKESVPHRDVVWVCLCLGKADEELADRSEGEVLDGRLGSFAVEGLDGVVEGSQSGGEPERLGSVERDLAVVDDHFGHDLSGGNTDPVKVGEDMKG